MAHKEVAQFKMRFNAGKCGTEFCLSNGEGAYVHLNFGSAIALGNNSVSLGQYTVVDKINPHVNLLTGTVFFISNKTGCFFC
jgi:hypothetical protein